MLDHPELKAGHFYWVRPAFNHDLVPEGYTHLDDIPFEVLSDHWTQNKQPALFMGYDENENEKWVYLGSDIDPTNWWPVIWIGDEILKDSP